MSLVENYYKENCSEIKDITSEAQTLQIATNPSLYDNRQLVWAYEITAEVNGKLLSLESESGLTKLCGCKECLGFGNELAEIYSIYMALASPKVRFSDLECNLWAYSDRFKADYDECLYYYPEMYQCGFLALLGDKLSDLIPNNFVLRFIETDKTRPF